MEYITTVHVNSVSEERDEEYLNWYGYVHFRDVMGMPGHISGQRFWQSEYQPKNADLTYRFWTIYELTDKELSTKGHQAAVLSWKMMISSAMDLSDYKESYWDGVYGSVPYACFAEFGKEQDCLVALIGPKDGVDVNVEDVLTLDVINKLAVMKGVYAANLYKFGEGQMQKKTAKKENFTHQLVVQLKDARDGIASWDALADEMAAELDKLQISICNYVSLHPRLKQCDRYETQQDRAIASLYHMFTCLPGYHASSPVYPINYTDILTPAIKQKLEALEAKEKEEAK